MYRLHPFAVVATSTELFTVAVRLQSWSSAFQLWVDCNAEGQLSWYDPLGIGTLEYATCWLNPRAAAVRPTGVLTPVSLEIDLTEATSLQLPWYWGCAGIYTAGGINVATPTMFYSYSEELALDVTALNGIHRLLLHTVEFVTVRPYQGTQFQGNPVVRDGVYHVAGWCYQAKRSRLLPVQGYSLDFVEQQTTITLDQIDGDAIYLVLVELLPDDEQVLSFTINPASAACGFPRAMPTWVSDNDGNLLTSPTQWSEDYPGLLHDIMVLPETSSGWRLLAPANMFPEVIDETELPEVFTTALNLSYEVVTNPARAVAICPNGQTEQSHCYYLDDAGHWRPATELDDGTVRIVFLALGSVATEGMVMTGFVTNPAWQWVVNQMVFVGEDGALAATPGSGIQTPIAVACDEHQVYFLGFSKVNAQATHLGTTYTAINGGDATSF